MQYSGTNVPVILSASKNLESFGERRLFADAQSDSGGGLRVTYFAPVILNASEES